MVDDQMNVGGERSCKPVRRAPYYGASPSKYGWHCAATKFVCCQCNQPIEVGTILA